MIFGFAVAKPMSQPLEAELQALLLGLNLLLHGADLPSSILLEGVSCSLTSALQQDNMMPWNLMDF